MKTILHRVGPLFAVLLFCGAAWLLYPELKHYYIQDIRQAIAHLPTWQLWAALGSILCAECRLPEGGSAEPA